MKAAESVPSLCARTRNLDIRRFWSRPRGALRRMIAASNGWSWSGASGQTLSPARWNPEARAVRAQSMMELISRGDAVAKGEISLRVGLPLLTLALGILAIPLAVMSARSGRAANLIVALLIYLIASNLFGAVKAAVSQTRLSFAMAWWPLPLALLLLAGVMIWWRMGQHMGPIEFIRAVVRSIRSPEPRVEG